MILMLSMLVCPWPCKAAIIGVVSAIVGGIVGYYVGYSSGLKARQTGGRP